MCQPLIPVVTTCNQVYWPGLVALHNSFLRHSAEGCEFWAILQGSEAFADRARERGIKVILNPDFPSGRIPTSWRYPEPFVLSYWRLLVPSLFDAPRSVYIDTDSIILQSLAPLANQNMREHPVAATCSNSQRGLEYGKPGARGRSEGGCGPMSSLYVFDRAAWNEKRVLERCVAAMQDEGIEFYTLSQGLLQYVLGDDWLELPWETQAHAGHDTYSTYAKRSIYTLHFMGTNPWDEYAPDINVSQRKQQARALWQTYA